MRLVRQARDDIPQIAALPRLTMPGNAARLLAQLDPRLAAQGLLEQLDPLPARRSFVDLIPLFYAVSVLERVGPPVGAGGDGRAHGVTDRAVPLDDGVGRPRPPGSLASGPDSLGDLMGTRADRARRDRRRQGPSRAFRLLRPTVRCPAGLRTCRRPLTHSSPCPSVPPSSDGGVARAFDQGDGGDGAGRDGAGNGSPAGAVGYDRTNPVSNGCSTKGLVEETRTSRTFGAWSVRLRRSTVCGTAWALITRTDGKKCGASGANCATATLTRIKSDGTKSRSTRKQVAGTTSQYSLQFVAVVGASTRAPWPPTAARRSVTAPRSGTTPTAAGRSSDLRTIVAARLVLSVGSPHWGSGTSGGWS